MATSSTPLVYGPDGTLRSTLTFTTTRSTRFFTGTMSDTTVDMEVSINGGGYTSDPDLISFEGTTWSIPNSSAFPNGVDLLAGANVILVRAISLTGQVSSSCRITVTLITDAEADIVREAPSGITVEQGAGVVTITVLGVDDPDFVGANFYASKYEGGGATGYTRINLDTVSDAVTVDQTTEITSYSVDSDVPLNPDGTVAADPLYVRTSGWQEDSSGTVLVDDFSERNEVPETTRHIRTTVTIESVAPVSTYSFAHSRNATSTSDPSTVYVGAFASTPDDEPLYYVITAVYYDSTSLTETESPYSTEVVGRPILISTTAGNFPPVTRRQITQDVIAAIFRSNPQLRVDPGSPLRDTFIDPFAAEAERIRFLIDFLHRAQSFAGLLQIDDPSGSGVSAPVATSAYKQALKKALFLTNDNDVQAVIDRAFESLASNVNVFRRPGTASRGDLLYYTTRRPTETMPVALGSIVGGGSIQYSVTRAASIPYEDLASFYDPTTGRYRVTVPSKATTVGSAGNLAKGQVRQAISGTTGLQVINLSDMYGGRDADSNRTLAGRALNALASVDSGTAQGYQQSAAAAAGVMATRVVGSGDDLMYRDVDENGNHRGGKVDIWVQGENRASVTDTFAFTVDIAKDIQFVIMGDPLNLQFQAIDALLSAERPILAMLNDPAAGYEFTNASTGGTFDLTGVVITGYNNISLDTSIPQPSVSLSDVVLGSYRRLSTNTFEFTRQPVRSITSVVSTVSGTLDPVTTVLHHPSSPMLLGRSIQAGDYLQIVPSNESGTCVPSGDSIAVAGEEHVMVGGYDEPLDSLGVNPLTIQVLNENRTILYEGPLTPTGNPDYTISYGSETEATSIRRVSTGNITSGQTVVVDYEHDENFTVTYVINNMVSSVQSDVNESRHVTADVLVKESAEVPVDISCTIILQRGASRSTSDQAVRASLSNLFMALRLDDAVRQSDVVAAIESVDGVSYVEVPLTRLGRANGASVIREEIDTGDTTDNRYISSWSTATVSTWLLLNPLEWATTTGGGPGEDYRGVIQDATKMALQDAVPPQTVIGQGAGRAYIIGSGGLPIPDFSDDATLIAEGYTTYASMVARRAVISGNRVLVSTSSDDNPTNHDYIVTYIVEGDAGAKNVNASEAENLILGNLDLTYDEER